MARDDQRRREIVAALRGVALFRGLTDEDLAGLAARVVRRRYARNGVIFGQGEPSRFRRKDVHHGQRHETHAQWSELLDDPRGQR